MSDVSPVDGMAPWEMVQVLRRVKLSAPVRAAVLALDAKLQRGFSDEEVAWLRKTVKANQLKILELWQAEERGRVDPKQRALTERLNREQKEDAEQKKRIEARKKGVYGF